MAIVDEKRDFIYIHIPKTAGNSIRATMQMGECEEFLGGHVDSNAVKNSLRRRDKEDVWNRALKFTFVRNPFDWLVSMYVHAKTWGEGYRQQPVRDGNMTFAQYLDFITLDLMQREQRPTSNKYQFQYKYCIDPDGNEILDFIGSFEYLKRDIFLLCKKLGIKCPDIPFVNKSFWREEPDYRSYYDKNTRAFVEKHFAHDLEVLGYEY